MSWQDLEDLLRPLRDQTWAVPQASVLRCVKHKIIGHEQQKEYAVLGGIVRVLAITLTAASVVSDDRQGGGGGARRSQEEEDNDDVRLQATIIVGSFALGGPAFIDPLLSTSIVPSLLASLNPSDSSPQLVLESLRTLNALVDALSLTLPWSDFHEGSLSDTFFQSAHVESLTKILRQVSPKAIVQRQIGLAACLIAKTCRDERHRRALERLGALDALGARLAGFIVSTGFVLSLYEQGSHGHAVEQVSRPAPATAELYPILDAIAAIIHGSKFRASQLLYGSKITTLLPVGNRVTVADLLRPRAENGAGPTKTGGARCRQNPIDFLLPQPEWLHHRVGAPQSHKVPFFGSTSEATSSRRLRRSDGRSATPTRQPLAGGFAEESPLVAWLIVLANAEDGINRLMALALLAKLSQVSLVSESRTFLLAAAVVPLLVRMLDETTTASSSSRLIPAYPPSNDPEWVRRMARERGPVVLAELVTDNIRLQQAAVEADAIKLLAAMLKAACQPADDSHQPMSWKPFPEGERPDEVDGPNELRLGDPGLPPDLVHKLRVRESTLQALAGLAPFLDDHRQMIIDNGITPILLDLLKPYEEKAPSPSPSPSCPAKYGLTIAKVVRRSSTPVGNPQPVLVAACALVRALSRSVSLLRTSLIDAGFSLPLFKLLTHPDIEVQIASTAVVCNLVLEFSPMRESIVEAGVLQILCAHAHSTNPRLRLNAVWALKHLVFKADKTVKVACLEELGHEWLVQLLCGGDSENGASCVGTNGVGASGIGRGFSSHANGGAMIHHDSNSSHHPLAVQATQETASLDRMDEDTHSVVMSMMTTRETLPTTADDYHHLRRHHHQPTFSHASSRRGSDGGMDMSGMNSRSSSAHRRKSRAAELPTVTSGANTGMEDQLAALGQAEIDPTSKMRRGDIAVQEQALDLVRNVICGSKADDIEEMIDYVFDRFGKERLFRILGSKTGACSVKTSDAAPASPSPWVMATSSASNPPRATSNGHHHHHHNHNRHPSLQSILQPPSQDLATFSTSTAPAAAAAVAVAPTQQPPVSQSEILVAVCFILVDIAAGHPGHRQVLMQQTPLLASLVPLFRQSSKQILTALAWIVINLTWVDDERDKAACRERALELRRLGFQSGLESIVKNPELDVKERSKTALYQMKELIGPEA